MWRRWLVACWLFSRRPWWATPGRPTWKSTSPSRGLQLAQRLKTVLQSFQDKSFRHLNSSVGGCEKLEMSRKFFWRKKTFQLIFDILAPDFTNTRLECNYQLTRSRSTPNPSQLIDIVIPLFFLYDSILCIFWDLTHVLIKGEFVIPFKDQNLLFGRDGWIMILD